MRSLKFDISSPTTSAWLIATDLTVRYLTSSTKADQLLERLPEDLNGRKRSTCQALFLGALRNGHRTKALLERFLKAQPRAEIQAIFLVTGHELHSETADRHSRIVHHAVEQSKGYVHKKETNLLNAVLRKLSLALLNIDEESSAVQHSHPNWLTTRWENEFGADKTEQLLSWNQQIPTNYLKLYHEQQPEGFELPKSQWPDFYLLQNKVTHTLAELLESGTAYIKDPSTRLAPELLSPQAGERILDLCAAPGGKAFDIAKQMQGRGHLTAVDLPGDRIDRLRANLDKISSNQFSTSIFTSDLLEISSDQFPQGFDGVMLDAPCSNTGVIQRRTDVKWRLKPQDIEACAKLQLQLLHSGARFVKPGGRIVYSTCSIEAAENIEVVTAFLNSKSGKRFKLEEHALSFPWETGHDGAGAFRLRRTD